MRAALLVPLFLLACRPDPGIPDYSSLDFLLDAGGGPTGKLPGPFPFVPGTRRLSFGIFYEGGYSDLLAVDDATRHYYVFNGYTQKASNDRVEGLQSDQLVYTGAPWWGGGLVWDTGTNVSSWTTLRVSLNSSDPGLADLDVKLLSGPGAMPRESVVKASAHGWQNDGSWKNLAIPLSAFTGADLANLRGPFVFGGTMVGGGQSLLIDNLYFE